MAEGPDQAGDPPDGLEVRAQHEGRAACLGPARGEARRGKGGRRRGAGGDRERRGEGKLPRGHAGVRLARTRGRIRLRRRPHSGALARPDRLNTLRTPEGSRGRAAAAVAAGEGRVEGRRELRARAARPTHGRTLPGPGRRVRDLQRGAVGLRRLAADRDHLQLRRPGTRRRPRPATKGERRVPPGAGQSPPDARRVRLAGACLRIGHARLRGRLADRPPHGRHERRLRPEMVERGVPAPEVRTSVSRLHGVRYARVGVRGESPRGNVRRLLGGPAGERRVRRIRHAAKRLGLQAREPRPGRAPPGQHQRFRGPVREEAVHGALQRRLGLVRRGPEGGTSADRVIGAHRRKRALSSRSASIKIENRIGEELISITELRAMREKDVSRLLTDEYAERILVATQITSRSVQEISDKYDIPIAACYRKIHELEEAGFLNVAQIVTTPKGKTMKLYRSLLKSAQLVYQEGIFNVKFELDVEKENNGNCIELNAAPDSRPLARARA